VADPMDCADYTARLTPEGEFVEIVNESPNDVVWRVLRKHTTRRAARLIPALALTSGKEAGTSQDAMVHAATNPVRFAWRRSRLRKTRTNEAMKERQGRDPEITPIREMHPTDRRQARLSRGYASGAEPRCRPLCSSRGESKSPWGGTPRRRSAGESQSPWTQSPGDACGHSLKSPRLTPAPAEVRARGPTPDTHPAGHAPSGVTGCGRRAVSRRNLDQLPLTVGGDGQARENVLAREVRKIREDFLLGHPGGQILKDIVHRDPQATDTGLPTAFASFDGDEGAVVHRRCVPQATAAMTASTGSAAAGVRPAPAERNPRGFTFRLGFPAACRPTGAASPLRSSRCV
jgi:hypothetical protein